MARKHIDNIQRVTQDQFIATSAALMREGYSVVEPSLRSYFGEVTPRSWGDFVSAQLYGGMTTGTAQKQQIPALFASSGNECRQGSDGIGTDGLGWMEWGFGNRLPNYVALLTNLLPYTAAGIKFNTDLCAGLGPQPMFDTARYANGSITTRFIRYKDGGTFLRGQIIDKRKALLNLQRERADIGQTSYDGAEDTDGAPSFVASVPGCETVDETYEDLCEAIEAQIEELEAALDIWQRTSKEVQRFVDENNIPQTWLSLVLDQELFGISFPELQLNQQQIGKDGKPVETAQWAPRVVGITRRPCHTTRLERMDDNGRINYVYCSNQWLDSAFVDQSAGTAKITALPALDAATPLWSLRERVMEARMNNVSVAERPTRFVLPTSYPTAGRPYYPTPSWQSIFGGDIYEYISTIISDRLNRKRNSNIIGRVIYLQNDYMQQLFVQRKAQGDAKKQAEIRDKLFSQINQWLANRDNAGQSLLAFTFVGTDGKEHRSFEIVEVAAADKSAADANEKETAEVSSIVFMALGLDPRLLGSSPMSLVNSSSGTDIRERYLLRLILKSPTQRLMLKPFEVLSRFNGWDTNLVWQVQREVMTTLDRSGSGLAEQTAESTK